LGSKKENVITEQVDSRMDDLFGEDDRSAEPDQEAVADENSGQNAEPDNRLDNFFEKEDKPEKRPQKMIDPKLIENSVIKDLKSVILSLEWEITDQVMQKLGEEVRKLEQKSKEDKIVVAFLQLMGSLGKYIRKKRAEAHPDSIRLLNSVYENLELAMLSDQMSEAEKRKMLVSQVSQYKKLKEDIVVGKPGGESRAEKKKETAAALEQEAADEEDTEYRLKPDAADNSETYSGGKISSAADMSSEAQQIQAVLKAMEDMRKTIQSEFRLLRDEIKLLRKNS
jgi:hypothetical protein